MKLIISMQMASLTTECQINLMLFCLHFACVTELLSRSNGFLVCVARLSPPVGLRGGYGGVFVRGGWLIYC